MSARTLAEIRDAVKVVAQTVDGWLADADVDLFIGDAVLALSRRNPRNIFQDEAGNGTAFEFELESATWVNGFSGVLSVYYPWEVTEALQAPPISSELYLVYEKTSGVFWLKLPYYVPSASEYVRIIYTTSHAISETLSACTISNPDWERSVIRLAAAMCLRSLAARAVALKGTLGGDTTDYVSRSGEYMRIADRLVEESGLKDYMNAPSSGAAKFVSLGRRIDPVDYLLPQQ